MTRFTVFFLSAFVLGLVACGQGSAVNTASAQEAVAMPTPASMKWAVIEDRSHIKFTAKQEGKPFTGEFTVFDADINFDPEDLTNSAVTVTIPLKQVEAGNNDRNATLPGKAWFSTKKFPEAVFKSSDITLAEDGSYVAKGELSLKGLSKPLDLPFSLTIGDEAVMTSQITLDRTLWNVGEDPWNTDEWVSKEVVLDIQVTATG
jgi:polyisoprenoid-binding protein YceI